MGKRSATLIILAVASIGWLAGCGGGASGTITTSTDPEARFTDGAWSTYRERLGSFSDELQEFGDGIERCGILVDNRELAAGSACALEAYAGINEAATALQVHLRDQLATVGSGCTAGVNYLDEVVGQLRDASSGFADKMHNLKIGELDSAVAPVTAAVPTFTTALDAFPLLCDPAGP